MEIRRKVEKRKYPFPWWTGPGPSTMKIHDHIIFRSWKNTHVLI